jgi:CRP-like cAMP-binding protein
MAKSDKNKDKKTADKDKIPPVVRLKYKKGELIVKEGDYGVSIYKVIDGRVLVYHEEPDMEVPLAGIGPGEIFGEMAFLSRAMEPRAASARAIEDTELEVWHPKLLSSEYEKMPPILKYVANQALKRLVRMNILASSLSATAEKGKKEGGPQAATRRRQYRKSVNLECVYSQLSGNTRLPGLIRDISIGGIGMEIRAKNTLTFTHEPGDRLRVEVVLPNEKKLDFVGKIESARKATKPGKILIGMTFTELSEDARKILGFFMMSA